LKNVLKDDSNQITLHLSKGKNDCFPPAINNYNKKVKYCFEDNKTNYYLSRKEKKNKEKKSLLKRYVLCQGF